MANLLKVFINAVASDLKPLVEELREKLQGNSTSRVISPENNPELIKAVQEEMRSTESALILSKLQDLEKAIFHLAARQQQSNERQAELTESIVVLQTALEELINGMEVVFDSDSGESENTTQAWDGKKIPPLN